MNPSKTEGLLSLSQKAFRGKGRNVEIGFREISKQHIPDFSRIYLCKSSKIQPVTAPAVILKSIVRLGSKLRFEVRFSVMDDLTGF